MLSSTFPTLHPSLPFPNTTFFNVPACFSSLCAHRQRPGEPRPTQARASREQGPGHLLWKRHSRHRTLLTLLQFARPKKHLLATWKRDSPFPFWHLIVGHMENKISREALYSCVYSGDEKKEDYARNNWKLEGKGKKKKKRLSCSALTNKIYLYSSHSI